MEIPYPLVVFTLLSGLSVGLSAGAVVSELLGAVKRDTTYERIARWCGFLAAPTIFIGLLVSTLHLSKRSAFTTGLSHIGSSWISNEGLAGIMFFAFIVLYAIAHVVSNKESSRWMTAGRRSIGLVAACCGLSLLFCQGMAYATVLPIPAWNTPLTVLFFAASSFVLGVLGMATIFGFFNMVTTEDQQRGLIVSALKSLYGWGELALVSQAAVGGMWLIFMKISPVTRAIRESLGLVTGPLFEMTLARIIIGLALPLVFLGCAWMKIEDRPRVAQLIIVLSFVCVILGEIIARQLFFMVAIHI